jgi:hypothetical protein
MLAALRGRGSERKLRLFACACLRAAWHALTDERGRRAVEVGERYADGRATEQERAEASAAASAYAEGAARSAVEGLAVATTWAVAGGAQDAWFAAHVCAHNARCDVRGTGRAQARLLRDIFGDPFGPARVVPASWRTPTVASLAAAIYTESRFGDLPVLTDALEEAGCADPDILGHLRGLGPHVRGCWVLDLVRSVD